MWQCVQCPPTLATGHMTVDLNWDTGQGVSTLGGKPEHSVIKHFNSHDESINTGDDQSEAGIEVT